MASLQVMGVAVRRHGRMRRVLPFIALLVLGGCASAKPPRVVFTLQVSGRTELSITHELRVTYLPRNKARSCTRYSWNAGRRISKIRTRDYAVAIDGASWSAEVPILAWDSTDECEWEADYVSIHAGSWYVGFATIDSAGRGARPERTQLRCEIGERSKEWICLDPDPQKRDQGPSHAQIRVDLVRK